jgi:hypothetical protein
MGPVPKDNEIQGGQKCYICGTATRSSFAPRRRREGGPPPPPPPPPPLFPPPQWRPRGPESAPPPSARCSSSSSSRSSTSVRAPSSRLLQFPSQCPPDDPICASVQAAPVGSGEGRLPAASRRAKAARPPRDRPCRRTRPPRPPPVPRCFSLSFGKLQASFRAGFSCPCRGYQNWIISSDATSLIHCFGHHCVSDKSRMLLLVENLSSCL